MAYTSAFLQVLGVTSGGRVAVGIDLRPSSPGIAAACIAAITAAGGKMITEVDMVPLIGTIRI